jgi:hypothetical protein
MARLQSVSEQIGVAREKSLAATKAKLVEVAKDRHRQVLETDPRPAGFTRYVDGVQGAAEEAVRADGVIVYDYPRLPIAVEFAIERLREFSPVKTGRYRDSHTIYINGSPVKSLAGWKPGDEVVITNTLPYARKIEIGKMKLHGDGSPQVYERAVVATNRRYGNLAKALFDYRGVVGGEAVNPFGIAKRTKRGSNGRFVANGGSSAHNVSDVRFPAIIFREL